MKHIFTYITLLSIATSVLAQTQVKDSIQVQKLEEVLIKSVRVEADSPITHSNLDKAELEKKNLVSMIVPCTFYQVSYRNR